MRRPVRGRECPVSRSIIVRSTRSGLDYLATVEAAHRWALADAKSMGCDAPEWQAFVTAIEEGRSFRLIGPSGEACYRAEPLLE
jgi:hypothetical protein